MRWSTKNLHLLSYEQRLNLILDDLFAEAGRLEHTLASLADGAGLAYTTATRINDRETKKPQLRTVMLLARAVGMEMTFTPSTANKRKRA